MLTESSNTAFCNGLKSRALDSASLLREKTPQEWVCYSGDHTIVVRWQQGMLGMGVGECDDEAYNDIKIVAIDQERTTFDMPIQFNEIQIFMDWTIDENDLLEYPL